MSPAKQCLKCLFNSIISLPPLPQKFPVDAPFLKKCAPARKSRIKSFSTCPPRRIFAVDLEIHRQRESDTSPSVHRHDASTPCDERKLKVKNKKLSLTKLPTALRSSSLSIKGEG